MSILYAPIFFFFLGGTTTAAFVVPSEETVTAVFIGLPLLSTTAGARGSTFSLASNSTFCLASFSI